ncbi:dTDP-4-dehydrorhamnose 3,5-epimerase [Azospirillum brasilense]|nr:dTDP-4-dehydrorhamnose 3,5-epimerase [Azospirillum brasilense]
MFEEIPGPLPGVRALRLRRFQDVRGDFVKLLHADTFRQADLPIDVREIYVSTSVRNTIRGMHFQTPPHDHAKFVTCLKGRAQDVVLDLRKGSPTYGQAGGIELDGQAPVLVIIPSGFAHGFLALEDDTTMAYLVTSEHAPANDAGVLWSSFGFAWSVDAPILSERDRAFPALADFQTPF